MSPARRRPAPLAVSRASGGGWEWAPRPRILKTETHGFTQRHPCTMRASTRVTSDTQPQGSLTRSIRKQLERYDSRTPRRLARHIRGPRAPVAVPRGTTQTTSTQTQAARPQLLAATPPRQRRYLAPSRLPSLHLATTRDRAVEECFATRPHASTSACAGDTLACAGALMAVSRGCRGPGSEMQLLGPV